MITQLTIENFRSVKNAHLPLCPLSYFCGPNASGKTNFTEALDFLGQTFERGLSFAIADKGGFYNMCFRRERRSRGAIGFRVKGEVAVKQVKLGVDIHFSLQTRGQAIRSDFYVETEEYSFTLTSPEGTAYVSVSRNAGRYDCTTS